MAPALAPRRGRWVLLRPLGWSVAVHLALFFLFSASAGRRFGQRPVGILMNWAAVTGPEAAILLEPKHEPERVPISMGMASGRSGTAGPGDPVALVASRLRDLRIPISRGLRPGSARLEPPTAGVLVPQEGAPRVTLRVEPKDLASAVGEGSFSLPEVRVSEPSPSLPSAVTPWTRDDIAWPPGKRGKDLGVDGPPLLTERTVIASAVPRLPSEGPPVVYRFAVAPDGRITQAVPLSVADPERVNRTYEALLSWRFAPLPSWVVQDELWGTVRFD